MEWNATDGNNGVSAVDSQVNNIKRSNCQKGVKLNVRPWIPVVNNGRAAKRKTPNSDFL